MAPTPKAGHMHVQSELQELIPEQPMQCSFVTDTSSHFLNGAVNMEDTYKYN